LLKPKKKKKKDSRAKYRKNGRGREWLGNGL